MRFIVWGTIPIGSFIGGILATVIGVRQGIFVGSIMAATAFLWVLFSPVRKLKEPPPAWQPEPTDQPGVEKPAPGGAVGGLAHGEPFEPVSEPPAGISGPPPD
jgi:hypothetical protein